MVSVSFRLGVDRLCWDRRVSSVHEASRAPVRGAAICAPTALPPPILVPFSFAKLRTARDWRSFGAFSTFLVALFTEMYGFPLTIYLLSGWLAKRLPGVDLLSHDAGHLLYTVIGWKGDPHLNPLHILSNVLVFGGCLLIGSAWRVLYQAQRSATLATQGPYARVRHPQYAGFITIMLGFLRQWPTLVTLVMFPILVIMYMKLTRREEREAAAAFGEAYARYAAITPGFIPRFGGVRSLSQATGGS